MSLLELMMTLTIVGVVVGVAIPNMRTFVLNGRLTSTANDLLASLQHARTEAIKRQRNVVLCATADATVANPVCTNAGATAWFVFQDTNGNWQADAGEPIIEVHPALDPSVMVRSDNSPYVAFSPSGFATPAGAQNPMRNIVFCDSRGVVAQGATSTARAMTISATGRTRISANYTDVTNTLAAIGATCP
ncbi:MAG: GspH/FimT family protein [Proteobacteria bacterium]|nr:GspH/FimT family protein [Pseudomonadota bacterium]